MKKRTGAIALLLAAALLAALLAGCGGGAGNLSAAAGEYGGGYDYDAAPSAPAASPEEAGGWSNADDAAGSTAQLLADPSRKIIYNAHLSIESTEYEKTRSELLAAAATAGGYVESSSQYGSAEEGNRWVDLTLRIPSKNYSSFLAAAENAGSLLQKDESTQDITREYVDVEARLASLKNQEKRLQELAAQAESLEDLLAIEQRLSDVQYEIESYTAQQRLFDDQVDYSTVTINLNEVRVYTPTKRGFGSRIVSAFQNSWSDFAEGAQDFAVGLVYALPSLLVLAALAAVVLVLVRQAKKRAAARPKPAAPAGKTPPEGTQPPKYEFKP